MFYIYFMSCFGQTRPSSGMYDHPTATLLCISSLCVKHESLQLFLVFKTSWAIVIGKIHLNVTNYFWVSKWSFSKRFPTKTMYTFLFFPNLATCSAHCRFFHFTVFKSPCYVMYWIASSSLNANIFLNINCMFWNMCNFCCSLSKKVFYTSI